MIGIVIITYNMPKLLPRQFECIKKHAKDPFKVIIIDNSSDEQSSEAIKYFADNNDCEYVKTNASSLNSSDSHAFAANFSYWAYKDKYSHLLYLDHDCFPIKDFSTDLLEGNILAGIAQSKSKLYLWPGCLMIDNTKIDKDLVDFSPNHDHRLDTGGNLYRVIEQIGNAKVKFFNEAYAQNPEFNKSKYNFYSLIAGQTFLHMVNGSNWAGSNDHEERINSLLNVIERIENSGNILS